MQNKSTILMVMFDYHRYLMMAKSNRLNVWNILAAFASYNYAFHPLPLCSVVWNTYYLMEISDHRVWQIFSAINSLDLVVPDDDSMLLKSILNIRLYKELSRLDFDRIHTIYRTKKKKTPKSIRKSIISKWIITVISKFEKNTFDLKK